MVRHAGPLLGVFLFACLFVVVVVCFCFCFLFVCLFVF